MEVNVDVTYDGSHNLSELMNQSKPGSNGSNNNAILVFLFLTSSFFHLLIKQKPDVRVKIIPLTIFFFLGSYVRHVQHATPYHEINVCSRSHFFTIELINKFESLYTSHLHSQSVFLSVSQLMYCNSNSYHRLLLLLSGDISLNPGPFHNLQPLDQNEWNIFKHRGLHFLHLNINSLLPKIDELRHIARLTNAAVIGISESKLDDSVSTSEIQIDEYDLLRCDRNRHGGRVGCYIRNDLSYNVKSYFSKDRENIFFELLLPNTKPIVVGIIYRPPNQTNFMEIFNENLSKVDTNNVETYILGDFNINLWQNGHYVFQKHNFLSCLSVPNDVKNYFDFCTMFGLKQLIESPTRITCSSSSIIDHILASFPDRVTQQGILNVGLSDHQLIYCTRKITRIKRGGHKQITFRSFKNYTIDGYEKALVDINFPEYKKFDNVNDAYSNFIQKLMEVIDKVAPVKSKRIKRNSQEWFDSEISEKLIIWNKLLRNTKKLGFM